jgi:hypothetical protein
MSASGPIVSCVGFSIDEDGRFSESFTDFFDNPAWDEVRRCAQRKAIEMRSQGWSGAAMLPHSELEYGGFRDTVSGLLKRFRLREERSLKRPSKERSAHHCNMPMLGDGFGKKRIGILTGGGDVPGLNTVIKSVTYRGSEDDIEVVGLRRGWEALTHLNLEDPDSRSHYLIPLNRENTRTIDRRGGTVLHSSRTNPSKIKRLPDHLVGKDLPAFLSTKGGSRPRRGTSPARCLRISRGSASNT